MNSIHLRLHRTLYSRYGIHGRLSINGKYACDTLEHPTEHLHTDTYPIQIRNHLKLHRKVPFILNPSSLIYPLSSKASKCLPILGIGNGPFRCTNGTILVGKFRFPGLLLHSADTFAKLIDRLDKAQNRGDQILITIT